MGKEELKPIIRELKKWSAHATTLLSLYIPPGRPISDVVGLLRQELSITENIKLKRTRSKVQFALEAAIDRLLKIPKTPPNGLIVFAGEHDETGETIVLVFSPPEPVSVFFYRTDKYFHTEFLESMIEESDVYGLIVVERDEATIGLLKGGSIVVLDELEGYIPGKHTKGGWSQRRFDRIIEEMVEEFYKKVAEKANNYFVPLLEGGKLKGILIGGPGYSKIDFIKGSFLDYRLQKIIIGGPVDVSSQGEPGLRELVERAREFIKETKYHRVRDVLEKFKYHLAKDDGLATYGEAEIRKALELGAVEALIVTEDHPNLAEFKKIAEDRGVELVVVSEDFMEYEWLNKAFGGVVAILRYSLSSI
ncbi:MAG: peptide chain release factor aRF-1 [Desulfurococcaceae archaeon]|nr:peptide chain release factor aRF-1 [Desulfurococcaceae archaeon]